MGHYGGLTPKRHLGISNAVTVGKLDLGTMVKALLAKRGVKSATTYKARAGHQAFTGTAFLKSTGSWAQHGSSFLV